MSQGDKEKEPKGSTRNVNESKGTTTSSANKLVSSDKNRSKSSSTAPKEISKPQRDDGKTPPKKDDALKAPAKEAELKKVKHPGFSSKSDGSKSGGSAEKSGKEGNSRRKNRNRNKKEGMTQKDAKTNADSSKSEIGKKNRNKKTPEKCAIDAPISVQAAVGTLSSDQVKILDGIRKNATGCQTLQGFRIGNITLPELMGTLPAGSGDRVCLSAANSKSESGVVDSLFRRAEERQKEHQAQVTLAGLQKQAHLAKLVGADANNLLAEAIAALPQVPVHLPDSGPFSTVLRPEIFKTAMEAYATTVMHCGPDGQNCAYSRGRSADFLRSHESNSFRYMQSAGGAGGPMGSFNNAYKGGLSSGGHFKQPHSGLGRTMAVRGGFQQGRSHNSNAPRSSHSVSNAASVNSPAATSSLKTRKPYFMPYLSKDAVVRGLENGDLIMGSLRVNQRNYEESYIDNPLGSDQVDILILGAHDRNRALHSDRVVVRVKPREQWLVREQLYVAWRSGHLNATRDDNGLPITVPPAKRNGDEEEEELLCSSGIDRGDLSEGVPLKGDGTYSRKEMILVGADVSRRMRENDTTNPVLENELREHLQGLEILRDMDFSTAATSSSLKSTLGVEKRKPAAHPGGKRPQHRLLSDMPDEDWGVPDVCLQKTAEVVFIWEAKNCRTAMGQLKVMSDGNRNWALFSPTDSRIPRMMIPSDQLPQGFFDRPQDYARYLFIAKLMEWQATAQFARGRLERTLGLAGDVDTETEGLLLSNGIDTREFPTSALQCLPIQEASQWKIDEKEFSYRRDLREELIFTIDPLTARDLDDALHVKRITDCDGAGTPGWEVGVHIADVSHFLVENTELDMWAAQRATSVYLVHKVIPMLPRVLCEELCSLNPGLDRLTFSVIWKMTDNADVKSEWFGRSVIRSCTKLAYEHAQGMIDEPQREWNESELPTIFDNRKSKEVRDAVLMLNDLAQKLKKKRMDNGALRIDQPKLKFVLDEKMQLPVGVSVAEIKEANNLVEEFMLLANMAVARKIEKHFPQTALLRRHPPPKQKVLKEVMEQCEQLGFPIDGSSSGVLSKALRRFEGKSEIQTMINQVLSMLLMKPMQLALYFCTSSVKSPLEYHHYALNVPYYTHFTSPIRRYPDVIVHRQLAACLGYGDPPSASPSELEAQAQHCNDKKYAAKTCSDASDETFFGLFVKECGPVEAKAVVIGVLDAAFDVLVYKYGIVKRVYLNKLALSREPRFVEGPPSSLHLTWKPNQEQVIQMCSIVDVVLSSLPEPTKFQAVIKPSPKGAKTLLELTKEELDALEK